MSFSPATIDMDAKTFNSRLSKALGCDPAEAAQLIEGLGSVFAREATELNSVAIPGFGTFVTSKKDEDIVVDPATGERVLTPPSITLGFQTSVALRKKLAK